MNINLNMLRKALREQALPSADDYEHYVLPIGSRVEYLNVREMRDSGTNPPREPVTFKQITLVSVPYSDGDRAWREWEIVL